MGCGGVPGAGFAVDGGPPAGFAVADGGPAAVDGGWPEARIGGAVAGGVAVAVAVAVAIPVSVEVVVAAGVAVAVGVAVAGGVAVAVAVAVASPPPLRDRTRAPVANTAPAEIAAMATTSRFAPEQEQKQKQKQEQKQGARVLWRALANSTVADSQHPRVWRLPRQHARAPAARPVAPGHARP